MAAQITPIPQTPRSRDELGALLVEEWDRRVRVYGRDNANDWMRKLDNDQFARLIEALRFGRRPK
jgi:hypothetical protein